MSTYQNWVYTQNPFKAALSKSFRRTHTIVLDHNAKLMAYANDPNLGRFYQRINPLFESWNTTYIAWSHSTAKHVSHTATVDESLQTLSGNLIGLWSMKIQIHYRKNTPEYLSLFRNGHAPFQKGRKDERIAQVGTLAKALKAYPVLTDLQEEVEKFYNELFEEREEQLRMEGQTRTLSANLKKLIPSLAKAMCQNLLGLTEIYIDSPGHVTRFFRMELIRTTNKQAKEVEAEEGELIGELEDGGEFFEQNPENEHVLA